MNLLLLLLSS